MKKVICKKIQGNSVYGDQVVQFDKKGEHTFCPECGWISYQNKNGYVNNSMHIGGFINASKGLKEYVTIKNNSMKSHDIEAIVLNYRISFDLKMRRMYVEDFQTGDIQYMTFKNIVKYLKLYNAAIIENVLCDVA